jgi:hypothetical protein
MANLRWGWLGQEKERSRAGLSNEEEREAKKKEEGVRMRNSINGQCKEGLRENGRGGAKKKEGGVRMRKQKEKGLLLDNQ